MAKKEKQETNPSVVELKKKTDTKKTKEKIDEQVLEELAKSLKFSIQNKENSEESELEEDIGNFDDFEFNSDAFMERRGAPALERIAGRQAGPVFVGGMPVSSSADSSEEKNGGDFKYMPGQNAANEPKYLDSDSHIRTGAESIDFERLGRDLEPWKNVNQETMFIQLPEARGESSNQERMFAAERFNAEKEEQRRKNPLESERKYHKYEPGLPKSR